MSAAANRTDRVNKLFKLARKRHNPVAPPANRSVLDHLLFSCCLEDSTVEAADEVFARLQVEYYDLNEVRVTTTAELAELMKRLSDPQAAAARVRKALHGVFEAHYNFDIEVLKKENLGKAQEMLSKYRGISPFSIAYVTQHALGGHAIPIDESMLMLCYTLGIVTEAEFQQKKVPGLERIIPKNKGVEFAGCVHPLAVEFYQSPHNKDYRALLLQIAPDAGDRFPKRGGGRKPGAPEPAVAEPTPIPAPVVAAKPSTKPVEAVAAKTAKKKKGEPAAPPPPPPAKSAKPAKPAAKNTKMAPSKPVAGKPLAGKSSDANKSKNNSGGKAGSGQKPVSKKTTTAKLAKKKPR